MTNITMRHLLLIALIALPSLELAAATPAEKRLAIMVEADQRDRGWVDGQAKLRMILRNRQGEESERSLRIDIFEVSGDGDRACRSSTRHATSRAPPS